MVVVVILLKEFLNVIEIEFEVDDLGMDVDEEGIFVRLESMLFEYFEGRLRVLLVFDVFS